MKIKTLLVLGVILMAARVARAGDGISYTPLFNSSGTVAEVEFDIHVSTDPLENQTFRVTASEADLSLDAQGDFRRPVLLLAFARARYRTLVGAAKADRAAKQAEEVTNSARRRKITLSVNRSDL